MQHWGLHNVAIVFTRFYATMGNNRLPGQRLGSTQAQHDLALVNAPCRFRQGVFFAGARTGLFSNGFSRDRLAYMVFSNRPCALKCPDQCSNFQHRKSSQTSLDNVVSQSSRTHRTVDVLESYIARLKIMAKHCCKNLTILHWN